MSLLNVSTTPDPLGAVAVIYELAKENYLVLLEKPGLDYLDAQPGQPATGFHTRGYALTIVHEECVRNNWLSPLEFTPEEIQQFCHVQLLNGHEYPNLPDPPTPTPVLMPFYPAALVIRLPRRGNHRARNTLTPRSLPDYCTADEFFAHIAPTNEPTPLSSLAPFQLPYDFRKDY